MSELSDMQKEYMQELKEEEAKELADNAILIQSFKIFSMTKGVELTDENFSYIQTIGIIAKYPNLVHLLNDKIFIDKEELVDVSIGYFTQVDPLVSF